MLRRELEKSGGIGAVTILIDGQYVEVGIGGKSVSWQIPAEAARLARFRREVSKYRRAGYQETPRSRARREFVFDDGQSRKFWCIEVDGTQQAVYFGRIGTRGRGQAKAFTTTAEAEASRDKLIAAKLRAGYVEIEH